MPYKNSAGNSGIAAEYATWRYFNVNLQRLGEYRSPRLSGEAPRVTADPVTNWMDVAGNVFQGAMGLFEARREQSYKLADDWLAKHSLKEYHQLMKDNNIPFQDDPIAMQRLKYRHGKILSELAEQDFQSRIDKGEFVGKEPEEVDAEHFKYRYDLLEEDSDVFPCQQDGDFFFNQGYWEDSNADRDKVSQRSQAVSDDYHRQQAIIDIESQVMGLVNSGQSSDAIIGALTQADNDYGYHITPNEKLAITKNVMEGLSATPWGDNVIARMADKKIPGLDKTFKDVFGDAGLRAYSIKAKNLRYEMDTRQRLDDWTFANNAINKGDFIGLQKEWSIEQGLNGKTDRADFFFKMMGQAKTQFDKNQKAQVANSVGLYNDNAKKVWARVYLADLAGGNSMRQTSNKDFWTPRLAQLGVDISSDKIKLTESDINMVMEDMLKPKVDSNGNVVPPELTPEIIAKGASRGNVGAVGTYNPYSSFASKLSNNVTSQMTATINAMKAGNLDVAPKVPDGFNTLAQIYMADPSAVTNLSDSEALELNSILYAQQQGFPVENMMTAMATYSAREKDKDFKKLKDQVKTNLFKNLELTDLGEETSEIAKNPSNRALLVNSAVYYYMLNGGNMTKAIESSRDSLSNSTFNFSGTLIPKGYFQSSSYPTVNPQYVADSIQRKVETTLSSRGVPESAVRVFVDQLDGNKLKVVDWGNPLKVYNVYTREDIEREAEDYVNSNAKKVEDFVSGLGVTGKGFGETTIYNENFRRND